MLPLWIFFMGNSPSIKAWFYCKHIFDKWDKCKYDLGLGIFYNKFIFTESNEKNVVEFTINLMAPYPPVYYCDFYNTFTADLI